METRYLLIYLALIHQGDWNAIYDNIKSKVLPSSEEIEKVVSGLDPDCKAVTILDPEYPNSLKEGNFPHPPFVLFCRGEYSLLKTPPEDAVAIVHDEMEGNDKTDEYARDNLGEIAAECVRRDIVRVMKCVSANGTKRILPGGGRIVVSCNGINSPEAKALAEDHWTLVVSEYPNICAGFTERRVAAGRIVAGLSKAMFVPKAVHKSTTVIDVACAVNIGRDVGVLPYPAGAAKAGLYNNTLISDGALLIDDIGSFLDLEYPSHPPLYDGAM